MTALFKWSKTGVGCKAASKIGRTEPLVHDSNPDH